MHFSWWRNCHRSCVISTQGPWDLALGLFEGMGPELHQTAAVHLVEEHVLREATCTLWWCVSFLVGFWDFDNSASIVAEIWANAYYIDFVCFFCITVNKGSESGVLHEEMLCLFVGVYISKTSYIRQGEESLDGFYRAWHQVDYYR